MFLCVCFFPAESSSLKQAEDVNQSDTKSLQGSNNAIGNGSNLEPNQRNGSEDAAPNGRVEAEQGVNEEKESSSAVKEERSGAPAANNNQAKANAKEEEEEEAEAGTKPVEDEEEGVKDASKETKELLHAAREMNKPRTIEVGEEALIERKILPLDDAQG